MFSNNMALFNEFDIPQANTYPFKKPMQAHMRLRRLNNRIVRENISAILSSDDRDIIDALYHSYDSKLILACLSDDAEYIEKHFDSTELNALLFALATDATKSIEKMFANLKYMPPENYQAILPKLIPAAIISGNPKNLRRILNFKGKHSLKVNNVLFALAIISKNVAMLDALLTLDSKSDIKNLIHQLSICTAFYAGDAKMLEHLLELADKRDIKLFYDSELDLGMGAQSEQYDMIDKMFDLAKRYHFKVIITHESLFAAVLSGNIRKFYRVLELGTDAGTDFKLASNINVLVGHAINSGSTKMFDTIIAFARQQHLMFNVPLDALDMAMESGRSDMVKKVIDTAATLKTPLSLTSHTLQKGLDANIKIYQVLQQHLPTQMDHVIGSGEFYSLSDLCRVPAIKDYLNSLREVHMQSRRFMH